MIFDADIKSVTSLVSATLKAAIKEAKSAGLQIENIDVDLDMDMLGSPRISLKVWDGKK